MRERINNRFGDFRGLSLCILTIAQITVALGAEPRKPPKYAVTVRMKRPADADGTLKTVLKALRAKNIEFRTQGTPKVRFIEITHAGPYRDPMLPIPVGVWIESGKSSKTGEPGAATVKVAHLLGGRRDPVLAEFVQLRVIKDIVAVLSEADE